MRFLFISLCFIPLFVNANTSKVICELEGTYSVSYKDIKKKYLSDGIELFKNLARQSQASLFLLKRARKGNCSDSLIKLPFKTNNFNINSILD